MISFAQTWSRITKQIKRKKSFQSHESSKSVRFYGVDAIYYTHSAFDYDRTPTEEIYDVDDIDDDDDDDDDDDNQSITEENILPATPPSPTNSLLAQTSFIIPSTATSGSSAKCHGGNVTVVYDQALNWEKVVPCLA